MTDPNIKPEPFDIDHDRGGRLTMRDGDRLWTSVDQGRTWAPVERSTIRIDGSDLSAVGTQTGRGQRARAVSFTDTPGPDGTGEQSGIMIEIPAEGWPSGWFESCYPGYRIKARKWSDESSACTRLPFTEPGRRAAWAMEGE